ncbi:hypothetical protein AVEN_65226-1 [Araneus ventricosus]|uniref:Uncharacterized protein n=1 Tax=Araneus ventricosus TaxID=182803 RepID=A0A4Y2AFL6_ARAVE|nr:hypothetical protein AVEN_65226-1 [Araneus ventricosus]
MKPFDFKYGRKKETDEEKEENVILMKESEDEDFGSFQQEVEALGMEEVIYLESSMIDFSTNLFVLIHNLGGKNEGALFIVCGIQEANGGECDVIGLRTTNLAKSKLASVVNGQFAISENQLKAILPARIFEVGCRKEVFGF